MQYGEEHFARGTREGKVSCSAQNLKGGQQSDERRHAHGAESSQADRGQHREGESDSEPFQEPAREKDLHHDREHIHPDVYLREEGGASRAIVELMGGDIRLLEINERARDAVKEQESANTEEVRRPRDVGHTRPKATADRTLGRARFRRKSGFLFDLEFRREKADAPRAAFQKESGGEEQICRADSSHQRGGE